MRNKKLMSIIKPIIEIRFKEVPSILDNRGKWADATSKRFGLHDWQIQENRIDLFNRKAGEAAYFSFNNMGYVVENAESFDEFSLKATSFINYVSSDDMLGSNLHIRRIGIRTFYCMEYDGSFDSLKDSINKNLGGINSNTKDILKVDLKDIASVYDLLDDKGNNIHLVCGPMKEDQLKQYFFYNDTLPEIGLYIDIDYWIAPDASIKTTKLVEDIKELINAESEKICCLKKIVIGES